MPDSLFGSSDDEIDDEQAHAGATEPGSEASEPAVVVASTVCPPIPGLYILRQAIPTDVQQQLVLDLSERVWPGRTDQVMVFTSEERPLLPDYLRPFLDALPSALASLPADVQSVILESNRPQQAILNLYQPGQGISSHVDLPDRYEDGIVGLSLLTSTVMEFRHVSDPSSEEQPSGSQPPRTPPTYAVRLRPGDLYVLSGDARWKWSHGIPYRTEDLVQDETGGPVRVLRGVRMSVTLRRMKQGADVIGQHGAS
ncbi:hypothetical protein BMF94_6253 [Rhodotorula taiwanensis]|uniref:Fe2OG dioxygenase domain-containing protein n=1 Tax=Rhodotorula taiwanensis TaxID=741276 RepID=A0A2S5B245_9BASI|nr:hypothetical protein BMF94_6253 [Rhodotorula taiwanensis]